MRRLDRYVLREVLPLFLGGTGAALLLLTTLKFFRSADALSRSRMPPAEVLADIAWQMPSVLVMTLPVATALAVSLATNRLTRDNELTSLRSSGVSLARVCAPLFAFALAVSLLNLAVAEWLVPRAATARQHGTGSQQDAAFQFAATLRSGKTLIYFNQAQRTSGDKRLLSRVMVLQRTPTLKIIKAPFASYDHEKFRLQDGMVHEYDSTGTLTKEEKFPEKVLNLPIDFSRTRLGSNGLDELSFAELTRRANGARLRGESGDALELEVARWSKLSLAAMCLSLGLVAPPLALRFGRAGGFTGVLLSVIMVFVAWNTWLLMKYIGQAGYLPPLVAAWGTNVAFGFVGLWLLRGSE